MARSRPDLTCCSKPGTPSMVSVASPESTAVTASGGARKGTVNRPMAPALLTISPARCGRELSWGAAKLSLPGLALASLARSATDWMPLPAGTASISGLMPTVAAELSSVSGLNCGFLNTSGVMVPMAAGTKPMV